jgi:tetratricopeptide (TPR) repeat protein
MTAEELIQQVRERQARARAFRKKGDALHRAGREEAAPEAFEAGALQLRECLELLSGYRAQLETHGRPLSNDLTEALGELVEVCGALGGMYQRLGRLDKALASYTDGALLEERFKLPGTYNRLNAVKYALLNGESRLSEVIPRIRELADLIDANIRSNKSLVDSGWALADLADCLALLGRTDEAAQTYAKFVSKAELKSPERTLDVLQQIAAKLRSSADPDASHVESAIKVLQANLLGR